MRRVFSPINLLPSIYPVCVLKNERINDQTIERSIDLILETISRPILPIAILIKQNVMLSSHVKNSDLFIFKFTR